MRLFALPGLGWLLPFPLGSFQLLSLQVFSQALSLFSFWDPYNGNVSVRCCPKGLLKLASFFFSFFFPVLQQWFPPLFLPAPWSIPPHLFCYRFPPSVIFISVVFYNSVWLVFIFSNSVKNFYLLALCFYSSLPSFVVVWTPSQVDCLCPCHLVLLGFYLVPSSEICSSAASLCLSFCLHVYVCSRLVTFLDLGEVAFCRRCPVSQQCLPFSSPKF